jgi:ABC-type multidrug transport system fused ATPase/permease subunit
MEGAAKNNSFINLSKEIFSLLPPHQARKAFYSIAASILLSVLEAFSLAACLPLLYHLVNPAEEIVSIPWLHNLFLPDSIRWSQLLTFVVLIFLFKNATSSWLVFRQLKFINSLYLFFTERVYQNFYKQAWTSYTTANAADTFRKIRNTAFDFTNYVLNSCLLLVSDLFICFVTTVVLAWIDYRIIFIALSLCLPIVLFYYLIRKNIILKIDRSFRDLTPKANMVLAQGIGSFAEAKIYGKENFFIRHFIDICTTTSRQLTNLKTVTTFPGRLLETAGILFFSIIIIYGKWFPGYPENTFILLGLLSLALYKIIPSLNRILLSISQIQSYAYAVSELKIALTQPERTAAPSARKMTFEGKIELNNICFKYSLAAKTFILNNIDLQINKGDFVVLTGPSGTGKSTLLHLLAGLIENYGGEMAIDGKIMKASEINNWQKKLSLVPQ